jgi:hypothetical protein
MVQRVSKVTQEFDSQSGQSDCLPCRTERQELPLKEATVFPDARLAEVARFGILEELLDRLRDRRGLNPPLADFARRFPAVDKIGCRFPRSQVQCPLDVFACKGTLDPDGTLAGPVSARLCTTREPALLGVAPIDRQHSSWSGGEIIPELGTKLEHKRIQTYKLFTYNTL